MWSPPQWYIFLDYTSDFTGGKANFSKKEKQAARRMWAACFAKNVR
jgi:hypothetical protein